MSWHDLGVAADRTHHVRDGAPVYDARFDEVLAFHAPGLAPVRRGVEAWHVGPDGRAAYERRFLRTFGYYEGLAAVVSDDGWHHVDALGRDAYPRRFDWCGNAQGGRCTVRLDDGRYLHIALDGRPAYAERYRYAGDYRDGIAVVQSADGRSTHVDRDGRRIHDRWFLDLDVFHKGFARARDEGGFTHVDRAGRPAYARRFAAVEPFYNGQARVERFDGGLEVIDETGETRVELRPALRSDFAALSGDLVGFWRTQAIATAVDLGVFEALPGRRGDIARRSELGDDEADRLLRAMGELALVTMDGGTWRATDRGELLRADHLRSLASAASEYGGPMSRTWTHLGGALRRGAGVHAPDVFGEVARDAGRTRPHHEMLRSYARHDYPLVPAALGLRGDERVVDAGGGLGTLAHLLLDAHPGLSVTVLDRPKVVELGAGTGERAGLAWRAGDIFEPWLIEADVVVLARILHDWDDEPARRILHHARVALGGRGRLFIVEMVLPETGFSGALCDLHLLVATGGRERTEAGYRRLLDEAGFSLREVRRLAALPSVLMAVPR